MKHMNFTAPMHLRAPAGSTLPTTFAGIAYSGGLVPGQGLIIDLSSTRVEARMQLLQEHRRDMCAGVVEAAANDGRQITVEGKLFSDLEGQAGERIAQFAKRGVPYQLSVGLFAYSEEFIGRNQAVAVNGKSHQGPLTILRGGHVREVSIVSIGADPGAKVTMLGSGGQRGPTLDVREIWRRRNSPNWH